MDPADTGFPTFGLSRSPACEPGFDRLLGCEIDDRYLLEELIGEGGFGWVFRARQKTPARQVAVKVSKRLAGNATRMVREADLLGNLSHDGIARVYDAGTWRSPTGPRIFVAMEYIEGAARIDQFCQAATLSAGERGRLFQAACEAVQVAHERGIVHRDLKPGNILIDSSGRPRIIDFGIAKALGEVMEAQEAAESPAQLGGDRTETSTGAFLGTHSYAAPEQLVGGEPVTTRTDVYGLGRVLQDLFPPDAGPMPRGLQRIASRCLSQEPTARYIDSGDLARAVGRWRQRPRLKWAAAIGVAAVLAGVFWLVGRPPSDPPPTHSPVANPILVQAPVASALGITAVAATSKLGQVAMTDGVSPIAVAATLNMTEPTQRLPMASLNGAVESLAFDGGGRRLAAGTQSGLSVWNVADLVRDSTPTVMQVPAGADFRAEHGGMAWAADGSRLYVCGENHTLRAFDAVSGGLLREERAGFDAGIAAICASANPQALFVGLANGGLLRWKPPANPEPVRAVHPDGGPMLLAADPTGHTIVSCGGDCIVRLRSGSDGSERARSEQLPGQPVALAYDGNHVFVAMNEADRSNFRIMGLCRSGGSGLEVFGQLTDAGEVKAITSDQGRFLVAVLEVGGRPIARCWKVEAGEAEPPHHELTLAGPRPSLD